MDLEVRSVSLDELTPDPRNARLHGERNLEAIRDSLQRFGQRSPLTVTEDMVVIVGNGRLEAARSLGWTEVVVSVFPGTEDEARAYALADNRSGELAEWDPARLEAELDALELVGWDRALLGFDRGGPARSVDEIVEDDPDDLRPDPVSRPGDVWILGDHRVVCGDATSEDDVALAVGDEPVAMVFTDPPYGVAYVGGTAEKLTIKNDALNEAELLELLVGAFGAMRTVLRAGGAFYVCSPSGALESVFRAGLAEAGLRLRQQLVWVKNAHVMGRSDYHLRHESVLYGWAEGEPPALPDATEIASIEEALYGPRHETVLYGWNEGTHDFRGGRKQNSVWEFAKPARSAEHPTMKPVALCAKALLNSSAEGGIVLDLFGGSGSTLIAAEQTGRRARLIELDPRYVDVIVRRWQRLTGRRPVRDGVEVDFEVAA